MVSRLVDADDILLDDGAIVEHLGDIVGGGADELNAALKGLVIGPRADECGQERVVNVDQVLGADGGCELGGEHLHVSRQHDQIALMLTNERKLFLLGFALIFFRHRHDDIRNVVEVGDALVVGMIGDDQRNLAAQFAVVVAVEQVLQAVVVLRNEDRDAADDRSSGPGASPSRNSFAIGAKRCGEFLEIKIEFRRIELDARQKEIGDSSSPCSSAKRMLPLWRKMKSAMRRDHAFAVGTGDEQDGGVMHSGSVFSVSPVRVIARSTRERLLL